MISLETPSFCLIRARVRTNTHTHIHTGVRRAGDEKCPVIDSRLAQGSFQLVLIFEIHISLRRGNYLAAAGTTQSDFQSFMTRGLLAPLHPPRALSFVFSAKFHPLSIVISRFSVPSFFLLDLSRRRFAQYNRNQCLDLATVNPLTPDVVSRVHAFARDNAIDLIRSMTYVSKIEIPKRYRVFQNRYFSVGTL